MKIIVSDKKDPYFNLSMEEVLLKDEDIKEDILFIYQNDNTIVFGRNQNVYEEINYDFVKKNEIKLVRRVSGGGAVYHDEGNINFSFITNNSVGSYHLFLDPIIKFLKTLGLNAMFKGKNDLVVDGFKISGNAQYKWKNRMFHHGTILFDSNLEVLGKALKPNKLKMESKSIKSARQRVTNIRTLLEEKINVDEFKNKLINFFGEKMDSKNYKKNEIKALMNTRKSKEWIFGKNPSFKFVNEKRFDGGTIKLSINTHQNKIKEIKFTGDFLSTNNFEKIENAFVGVSFDKEALITAIETIDEFKEYFGILTKENIIELFFEK